ncbi:MAG: PQQ-like beta-propeller repeat protein, partial [Propionibacteriaceae bacterium]|nr:PQQ-like beta-propeller repeat protein [Propionibacteriaceae bacterium]
MMICPRCGATYPDASSFCGRDGTRLVPQIVADPSAATQVKSDWQGQVPQPAGFGPQAGWAAAAPATAPAPKPRGKGLALVLAIALVVVVVVGGVLMARDKLGILGGLKVTGTAPAYTEDWTRGVTQSWSQTYSANQTGMTYSNGVLAMSPDGWVVADGTSVDGVDAATGQVRWRHDFGDGFSSGCTNTVYNGKVACFGGGFTGQLDNAGQLCLIDIQTGDPTCIDMTSIVVLPPGSTGYWTDLWFADGALIVAGNADENNSPKPYWEVARLSLPSLDVKWANTYNDVCDMGSGFNEPSPSQVGNGGITGDVLWFGDSYSGGPPLLAIDIRDGQRVLAQDKCATIYELTIDTFVAPPEIPAGPLTLPGGGQITIVNSGSAIEYANGQLPSLPI